MPVLQVIVPLMASPLCLLLTRARLVWLFTLIVSGLAFLISGLLLQQVMASGTIIYALGGWDAPWGIEYRIDQLNAFLLLIISALSTVILLAAHTSIRQEIPADRHTLFYILYLLSLAGMLGIVATGDVFNVFVFLEISSLSAYALIALGKDRRALWASYQYLIMGTIGATFILIGIGLMYQMTGTLNMDDLSRRLPEVAHTRTIFAAFAFIIVGGKMIFDGVRSCSHNGGLDPGCQDYTKGKMLVTLSVATSLDALGAGVGLGAIGVGVMLPVSMIGVAAFLMTLASMFFVRLFSGVLGRKAPLIGGIVLVSYGFYYLFYGA